MSAFPGCKSRHLGFGQKNRLHLKIMAFTQAAGRENAKEEASAWWAFFSEGDLVNALRVKFKPMPNAYPCAEDQ